MKSFTLFRTERPKTIPCPAAHLRIGHIREYPPGVYGVKGGIGGHGEGLLGLGKSP